MPMNFGSEGTFQPSKGKAMAQSYRVEFLRLHRTESMTPKSFSRLLLKIHEPNQNDIYLSQVYISSQRQTNYSKRWLTFREAIIPKEESTLTNIRCLSLVNTHANISLALTR